MQRNFKFDQDRNGQWTINSSLFSCNSPRFTVQQNSLEQWTFDNGYRWSHPIHVHLLKDKIVRKEIDHDIFIYSITVNPEKDTPAVMKAYAKMHGVNDPQWMFLTGKPDELDDLRHKLGFADPNPTIDRDKSRHSGMLRYGNEPMAIWGMCQGSGEPEWIAQEVGFAVPRQFKRHPRVNE